MNLRLLKPVLVAATAAGCLCTLSARAEGFYLGGNAGKPKYENGINGISGNSSDISGKLYLGYQFNANLALEAGASDLGSFEGSAGKVDGKSQFLDAVGILPMNDQWSLLGRLGWAHVALATSKGDAGGGTLKLGAGAQYALTSTVALRGEWERYRPDVFGTRANVDQYSVGVRVGF